MSENFTISLPWGAFNRPKVDFDDIEFDWPPRTNEYQRTLAIYAEMQNTIRFAPSLFPVGSFWRSFLSIVERLPRPVRQRIYRKAYSR